MLASQALQASNTWVCCVVNGPHIIWAALLCPGWGQGEARLTAHWVWGGPLLTTPCIRLGTFLVSLLGEDVPHKCHLPQDYKAREFSQGAPGSAETRCPALVP